MRKQFMGDLFYAISLPASDPQPPASLPSETFSVKDEDVWGSIYSALQEEYPGCLLDSTWLQSSNQPGMSSGVVPNQTNVSTAQASPHPNASKAGSILYQNWSQNNNQPGTSGGVVPNLTNVSTAQASPHPNTSKASPVKRSVSCLSEADRERKRKKDKDYRERVKKNKEDMELKLEMLTEENESLKKENESLKGDHALMHQTLRDKAKEMDGLRNDLFQLKSELGKQNVLVQTLSSLLADPVQLENERLKDENALLRENANLSRNMTLLAEENAKLKIENKVLMVQNDALCGKIISDDGKKRETKS
ncbi:hypothetical protein DITRI_Ditri06bG0008800 [Diplodiscus trichospermus]